MMSFRPLRRHQNNETTVPPSSSSSPAPRPVPYNGIYLTARLQCERPSIGEHPTTSIIEQRLVAGWKELLQWHPTLQICTQQNQIVLSQPLIHNLTALVFDLYNRNNPNPHGGSSALNSMLLEFLSTTPPLGQAYRHLRVFTLSAAPQALVMLYTSSHQSNIDLANHAIREFITKSSDYEHRFHVPKYKHLLALVFSNWLAWAAGIYDPLYTFCRANLTTNASCRAKLTFLELEKKSGLPELANRLLHDLDELMMMSSSSSKQQDKEKKSCSSSSSYYYYYYVGPALRDVKDLAAFMVLLKNEIQMQMLPLPLTEQDLKEKKGTDDVEISPHLLQ